MPMKKKVPVLRASGTLMPKVLAIDGALKPIDSTCIASASHTRPKMTNSRYWNRPTPAVRMPVSTLMGRDDVMKATPGGCWGG